MLTATRETLNSILFDTVPDLATPLVSPVPEEVLTLGPHPLDLANDLGGALHVFSMNSDMRSLKSVKPKLRELSIIAFLMQNPTATTLDVCTFFKCGPGVVRAVMNSDMFKHQLALAQEKLLESKEYLALHNEMAAGAQLASEVVNKSLLTTTDPELALKAVGVFTKALGMGVSKVNVNVNAPTATADMLKMAREANIIDVTPLPGGLLPDGLPQQAQVEGSDSGASGLSPKAVPFSALSEALYSETPPAGASYENDETFNILDGGVSPLTGRTETASLIVPGHVPLTEDRARP